MGKTKIISCVSCAIVVLMCLIFYSGYVSRQYYEVCTPYGYSPITGYEIEILEEVPEGYEYHMSEYAIRDEMKVVEITYELTGVVNDSLGIQGNLCYYYGEDGGWIDILEKDEDYWGEISCDGYNIIPPGERVLFREYVLVPKNIGEITANWVDGDSGEMVIKL